VVVFQPISIYELLTLIVSIAGFITVAISVLYLVRQTKELSKQTKYVGDSLKASVVGSTQSQLTSLDEIFITYPETRPYFFYEKDISCEDPNYERVSAIAEFMLDFFDTIIVQVKEFPETWPRNWWEASIIDTFAHSPFLCGHLELLKRDIGYTNDLVILKQLGEEKRKEINKE
jgi:hypothetical protein